MFIVFGLVFWQAGLLSLEDSACHSTCGCGGRLFVLFALWSLTFLFREHGLIILNRSSIIMQPLWSCSLSSAYKLHSSIIPVWIIAPCWRWRKCVKWLVTCGPPHLSCDGGWDEEGQCQTLNFCPAEFYSIISDSITISESINSDKNTDFWHPPDRWILLHLIWFHPYPLHLLVTPVCAVLSSPLHRRASMLDFYFDHSEERPLEAFEDIFASYESKK